MKKLVLLVVLCLFLLSACNPPSFGIGGAPDELNSVRKSTPEGIIYETFYIEGMPCMRVGRGTESTVWSYDGVTCDWSKWEGNGGD